MCRQYAVMKCCYLQVNCSAPVPEFLRCISCGTGVRHCNTVFASIILIGDVCDEDMVVFAYCVLM